jgi:hypothetical protein
VQPNDIVGGWSITVTDDPPSAGYPEVATLLSRASAEHIVELHDAYLAAGR